MTSRRFEHPFGGNFDELTVPRSWHFLASVVVSPNPFRSTRAKRLASNCLTHYAHQAFAGKTSTIQLDQKIVNQILTYIRKPA